MKTELSREEAECHQGLMNSDKGTTSLKSAACIASVNAHKKCTDSGSAPSSALDWPLRPGNTQNLNRVRRIERACSSPKVS
ncbi:hypothetical protein RRG08_041495 [Elysia crispata]|uniref:Uncharacterized protein n=1 Tax=Elysia crispata TaxID=231223 RepID=A0AAE1CRM4_9GAST|nr:hypothetical protein RRG08_041495 [Elysia crispata]